MIKHVFISGRVQGVGFRHFTLKNAEKLGIKGWVKNLDDGRVEALFEGEDETLNEMLELVEKGPRGSYVKNIELEEKAESPANDSFEVRH